MSGSAAIMNVIFGICILIYCLPGMLWLRPELYSHPFQKEISEVVFYSTIFWIVILGLLIYVLV